MAPSIVIIEDNEQNLYLFRFLLEQRGYRVSMARRGEEGIELVRRAKPSLVLLDIQLPDMDGHDVARRLQREGDLSDIPILAVTSHAMNGDRECALSAGCVGYLEKPIDLDLFLELVAELLDDQGG